MSQKPKETPHKIQLLNQKVGIFYNKDKKTQELQTSNTQLQKQIQIQMALFYSLSTKLNSIDTQIKSLQNENSFMEIQSMMMKQSIASMDMKIQIVQPLISSLSDQIQEKQEQYVLEQQLLKKQMEKHTELNNTLLRFKEQEKLEKMMLKSEQNIVKIHGATRKSAENYQKNVEILQNKLEGRKKYLTIFRKKYQKMTEEQEAKDNQRRKQRELYRNESTFSNKKYPLQNFKSSNNLKNEQKNEKVQKKPNIKQFNELTRKKNAILMKKK